MDKQNKKNAAVDAAWARCAETYAAAIVARDFRVTVLAEYDRTWEKPGAMAVDSFRNALSDWEVRSANALTAELDAWATYEDALDARAAATVDARWVA